MAGNATISNSDGTSVRRLTVTESSSLDNGLITTDGNGNATVNSLTTSGGGVNGKVSATVVSLSTGNTINTAGVGVARVTAAAAVTGIILQAGTSAGQQIIVEHQGAAANTITFAASGTSNVADGTSAVITGPTCKVFVWDVTAALWYHNS